MADNILDIEEVADAGEYFTEDDEMTSQEYIEEALVPEEEYKRFVLNQWNYSDIPNQQIKFEWLKQGYKDDS